MKTLTILFAAILLINFGCQQDPAVRSLDAVLAEGDWKVTFFQKNNSDGTEHFQDFTFKFEKNGRALGVGKDEKIDGAYSSFIHDEHNDLSLKFPIGTLDQLNNGWHVEDYSSMKISLRELARDGSLELLVLERN